MIISKPPKYLKNTKGKTIFLAGSIEMGKAIDWQSKIEKSLKDYDVTIFNPRRDDWDSSWEQSIENKEFNTQVTWELDHIDKADIVIVYFDKDTQSPITLLELGLGAAKYPEKFIVFCPDGFWRKGNVDIVCERYSVRQVDSIEELIKVVEVLIQ